jgi:anaphase-promoting complex subunit 2
MHFIRLMRSVGLAGERFHVMLGEVMNEFMSTYIQNTYRGQWAAGLEMPNLALYYQHNAHHDDSSILEDTTRLVPRSVNHAQPSSCIKDLCAWVDLKCMSLVWKIQQEIDDHDHADAEKWKEIGIRRLANLRVSELYDIVVAWPHAEGALSDLRTAVTSPQQRLRLTNSFTADLQRRLLHPGASTLEILRSYISMIWSFHSLDHSRVLLDRISYPLQLYLCSRDDTVRIIISGLLADPQEHKSEHDKPSSDKLVELASLLNNSTDANPDVDDDWNWNDMEWLPDPVDAGPGYKRRKSADVVGTLIGVLGSPEIFIKEFQSIIGENLLGHQGVFERESSVLELLKSRFGEAALQSCEVMLRDIRISHQLNADIRQMEHLSIPFEQKEKPTRPQLHAKILSRLFWPPNVIENEHFKIPPVIAMLQGRYDTGFEAKKGKRKLNWLNYLGQATVELELEDRTIRETCHTYQASVIYAFQSQPDTNTPVVKSFDDLWTLLEMDEDTLRAALRFWMSKRVLREVTEGSYQVLERLDGTDIGQQQEESLDTDVDDIPTSKPSMSKEEQMMYWQFIQGMLKNSAAQMPLAQIAMMLKMLIAEGFPWSNVELGEFLKSKVDDGDLELAGGKYKLKRK